ncbi:uncharacterized protein LOC107461288 [Arachis duranensis]|uniref:Uncharacterized protein LOC107461288 n=1 Tax=Arachis duranensis TaxID=130453 RepID=A0A9C6THV1_ARADU|nr:uncharacterized protein LOC107461288 [Arachis duranensis]
MANKYDMLQAVSAKKLDWSFNVWVARLWVVPQREDQNSISTIEMVLCDYEGNRIQASVPRSLSKDFIYVIKEGEMYCMKNFIVGCNNLWIKSTQHSHRLIFLQRTTVMHVFEPTFPFKQFDFTSIGQICEADIIHENQLIDVIAEVIGKETPRELMTKNGKDSKRLVLLLEDIDKNTISCTLFGELVDRISPFLERESSEPLIVVFQLFRPRIYKGNRSIQSSFYASNIHINPPILEVNEFKKKLLAFGSSESQRISHISSRVYHSPIEELSKRLVPVKRIEDVLNSTDGGVLWILGSIVALDVGKDDWFYAACIVCQKKAKPIGDHFSCDFCVKEGVPVSLRYRLKAYVTDGSGSLCVVIWENEAKSIVGMEAKTVRAKCQEDNSNNYPSDLDVILDKKMLFKINIKANNITGTDVVYNVTRICDDHDTIKKFTHELDEDSGSESVNETITINSLRSSNKRLSSEIIQQVAVDLDKDRYPQASATKVLKRKDKKIKD